MSTGILSPERRQQREEKRQKHLKTRYRSENLFRGLAMGAILFGCAFLVFFFVDIIRNGYPAFLQTEIQVPVTYNAETVEYTYMAVPEKYERLVSRGFLRLIPRQVERHPELMGATKTQWVLAEAEVDQFLKDKPNRLKPSQKKIVKELQKEGRLRQVFNIWFFTEGDSKLPELAGIMAAAIGSVYVLLVTMCLSVPIGVLTSVYLEEFAPDNKFTRAIEVNINNLAAIPSILYGLLGLAVFINFMGILRSSVLVGGMTLALMTLPVLIISTRAALRAVPDSIREGAYAVGVSRWQVVQHHVLPLALPGILTGSIIGLAQAMGETAPLIIVGMIAYIPAPPDGLTDAATVLPAQIYTWSTASLRAYVERTAAGIIVLLTVLLSLNATAIYLRHKFQRRW